MKSFFDIVDPNRHTGYWFLFLTNSDYIYNYGNNAIKSMYKKGNENSLFLIHNFVVVMVVVWQLSCRGSYHFLKHDCVADAVPLHQYTHWNWYSFRRPRKDDRLSQPPGVLIQRPTGLELRTRGSQVATLTTEPTPGCALSLSSFRGRRNEYQFQCVCW